MTPDEIAALFTRADGRFLCARWDRPVVPVIFGVAKDTLPVLKGAIEAVVTLAGHRMAETDPELGANLLVFFCRDWAELREVPDLDRLVPDLGALTRRLAEKDAPQYRLFRFEADGAIRAAVVLLRMRGAMAEQPAEDLALAQAAEVMLTWSDTAFAARSPLALAGGQTVLRPEIGGLIRAAYDPVLPAAATDRSHAMRLSARLAAGLSGRRGGA